MKVLGVVNWTNTDKGGHPIAGVQPLYEVQKSEWRKIDAGEEFPTQGQVFWPAAQAATEGLLVFFRAEPNRGQKDEYMVLEPKPATEVLDLRALGGATEVRAALVEGVRRQVTVAGRALIWCQPSLLVGPVDLTRTPMGTVKLTGSNLAKVPTYANVEPRRIHDGRQERLLRVDESAPSGYVDWDDDPAILKRALQAAVRLAKQAGKDTGQTKRQIEEAAEALAAQGTGPDAQLDLYRLERARAICTNTALLTKLAPEVVDELRAHPSIADKLARLEGEVRGEVERTARADAEQKLTKEREALREVSAARDRTRDEVASEERKLDELRRELETLRGRASQAAQEIEDAVGQRVRSALERPAELLAEVSVLRPLLTHLRQVSGGNPATARETSVSTVPVLRWSSGGCEIVTDRAGLQRALTAAARARGVAPASMLQLHAAVAAGLVPVLMGPGALAILAAYAHAACGARLAVLHVSPAFIQPHDLLGTALAGTFEPHATGLLCAGAAALGVDGASLLVLEGANRSPLESSLVPLLQLRDAGLPVIAPQLADAVQIPPGLRLAATLVAGATTVPVTPQLWCHAVALSADPAPVVVGVAAPGDLPLASDLFALGDVPTEAVESLVEAWPDCNELRPTLERFGAALARLYSDGPRVRSALLEGVVLPFVVSTLSDDEQEDALTKLAGATDSTLAAAAKRLRRRLR